jgi:hypothetical protein
VTSAGTTPHAHLDLDALADVLAAEADGAPVPPDAARCPRCTAALAALREALPAVAADLRALPEVPPVPAELSGSVLPPVSPAATVLPAPGADERPERRAPRWLLPAGGLAAAAVLVVGGGLLLTSNATDSASSSTAAVPASAFPVSASGTHYAKSTLPAAVPRLLRAPRTPAAASPASGAAPTARKLASTADPLADLRTPAGLASCLAGLSDPSDTGVPLALDYAAWGTRPALVVVLPASRASKVDVFVVGAGCTSRESELLYYLRADRPIG